MSCASLRAALCGARGALDAVAGLLNDRDRSVVEDEIRRADQALADDQCDPRSATPSPYVPNRDRFAACTPTTSEDKQP